jgi:hypothetical protein
MDLSELANLKHEANERDAFLKQLATQQLQITNARELVLAQEQEAREKERALIQTAVGNINALGSGKFRVVATSGDSDDETDVGPIVMEQQWGFGEIVGFLTMHQAVFVTKTSNVFALFPVEGMFTHSATDTVLCCAIWTICERIRVSGKEVFDMLNLLEDWKIRVPQNTPKYPTLTTTFCGHFEATKKCLRGCNFCKVIFYFRERNVHYGNAVYHDDGDDDVIHKPKEDSKKRSASDNQPTQRAAVSSSSSSKKH